MIDRAELLQLAENLGLTPAVVEKDYVLGWLLAGIRANEQLGNHWVFKGGTCLKKCYFETYRFSEDLDYTITNEAHLDQAFLTKAFTDISAWIYEQTGLEIPADRLRFEVYPNKRNRLAGEGRIYYRGPIAPRGGDLPRIKLDLTTDELLAMPPVERPVVHPFSDAPEGGISALCYAYEEVFGEKVRALGERARPRDLYDVINLYRHDEFQPQPAAILDVLKRKCAHKAIELPTLDSIHAFREELAGDWPTMLAHQLPALPPLDSFWDALPEFFAWLTGGARPAIPQSHPLAAGEVILRQPLGTLSGPGMVSSALEIIRFAAANRLTVEIDYVKEDGEHTTREIEAYSLRRTAAGRIVLHAHDMVRNEHRSYRTDRIRAARATSRTFTPRIAIELTPGGAQAIPQAARPARAASYSSPWSAARSGPTYVYECPICSKKFRRTTRDSALRPHKAPDGWNCSGRRGLLVDTVYYNDVPMREEDLKDFSTFLEEFQRETDRGAALVGAALIDQKLSETLRAFMVKSSMADELLDGGTAPLGTFSARIKASFALGLIDDHERHECDLIRRVRNEFAHRTHGTDFADSKISSLCNSLKSDLPGGPSAFTGKPRGIFINAVVLTALRLTYRSEYVARERRTTKSYP